MRSGFSDDQKRGWLICSPALLTMTAVTAYLLFCAFQLRLFRYDLRFPYSRSYIGLDNYLSVFNSPLWREGLLNTVIITISSGSVELLLGMLER